MQGQVAAQEFRQGIAQREFVLRRQLDIDALNPVAIFAHARQGNHHVFVHLEGVGVTGNGRGTRTIQPEFLARFSVDRNKAFRRPQIAHTDNFRSGLHHGSFVKTDDIADQHHLWPAMAFGLGRIANGLHIALVQMLQPGQLHASSVSFTARLEIIGNLDNRRHSFAHLTKKLQANGPRHRRHLVQHPARSDDDAVRAFLLYPRHASEEFVRHILAQTDLAASGPRQRQNFFIQQFLAAGVETLQAEFDLLLLVNFPEIVIQALDFQPVAIRVDHLPPGQIVQRCAPQHSLLAPGVHRNIAADAGSRGRSRVDRKYPSSQRCRFRNAIRDHASAGANRRVRRVVPRQNKILNRPEVDQLFGIDHGRMRRQRHGTAGVTRTTATSDDGQPGLDTTAHQMADFFFGIRVQHHEGILNAPVGRIRYVRNAGQTVKSDVVAPRMLAQHFQHLTPQVQCFAKACFKAIDRLMRRFNQLLDLGRTIRVFPLALGPPLFHLSQAMAQGIDQRITPFAVIEQIVFQIGITLDDPDIPQHFVQHTC